MHLQLSTLVVSPGILQPKFDPSVYSYTLSFDGESANITASVDANAGMLGVYMFLSCNMALRNSSTCSDTIRYCMLVYFCSCPGYL